MKDDRPVVFGKDADPGMQRAFASARETFRWFWQELAWEKRRIVKGLDFGDPSRVKVFREPGSGGALQALFGKPRAATDEHPMSAGMAVKLKEQLAQDPSLVAVKDDRGWTLLHEEALAGSVATVKVLLQAGADRTAVTGHGMTPVQLAASLGWEKVVAVLEGRA